MLATTLAFDWDAEAKRAAALLAREHAAMGPETEALLQPAEHHALQGIEEGSEVSRPSTPVPNGSTA